GPGRSLPVTPLLNAIGVVTSDMGRSIRLYRLLAVEVPATPEEPHVDSLLPNGVRFLHDAEEEVRKFREWSRQTGNQVGIAFECESPAQVDELYACVVGGGFQGDKEPWDAFWGQHYAQLRDLDGVPVDLYSAL